MNGITQDVVDPTREALEEADMYTAFNKVSSRDIAVYWWRMFSPLWNTWSGTSDIILALMIVERYLVMRRIDQESM